MYVLCTLYILCMSAVTSRNNIDENKGTNAAIFLPELALFLVCYFCSPPITKLPTLVTQPGVWSMPQKSQNPSMNLLCTACGTAGRTLGFPLVPNGCMSYESYFSISSKFQRSKVQKSQKWVRKLQVRKVPHLRKVSRYNKFFKSANLRSCDFAELT
jgi:hypothetical protein